MGLTQITNKLKGKILSIAVIVLALFIASNIYKRQNKEIGRLKEQKETEINNNAQLESIRQLENKIEAYKNLLTKKDASAGMNTLTNLAKECGVKITSIRPLNEQRSPDYIKFPLELMINTAGYHDLGKFISKIESDKDVFIIESLDIISESQAKELTVNLKVSTIASAN